MVAHVFVESIDRYLTIFSCAYGVHGDLSPLSLGDRFLETQTAGIVLAIADYDQNAGDRTGFVAVRQLVGSKANRIPECSSATRSQLVYRSRGKGQVRREILYQQDRVVHSDHEGEIILAGHHLVQKLVGSALLEREAIRNRVAGIDDETQPQWQLRFVPKAQNGTRCLMIIANDDLRLV